MYEKLLIMVMVLVWMVLTIVAMIIGSDKADVSAIILNLWFAVWIVVVHHERS